MSDGREIASELTLDVWLDFVRRHDAGDDVAFEELCRTHPELASGLGKLRGPAAPQAADGDALKKRLRELAKLLPAEMRMARDGVIARGGMGVIYRARDLRLHRALAVKEMASGSAQSHPIAAARFYEEAQITAQLDHPGIVPVHECGVDAEGRLYFAMKLVQGRDLREILELTREGQEGWTLTRLLGVLLKVCDAMAYAHSKGVIHRDLKPANIMVGSFGEVYVMDWGLARALGRPDVHGLRLRAPGENESLRTFRRDERKGSPASPLVTMDGAVVGTPTYMAPEQARGEIHLLSPRSDVYSLGAVLYQVLTGEIPYVPRGARLSVHTVLARVIDGPPLPIHSLKRSVPFELVAIAERAMARDPGHRYPDTLALAEDLRAFLEGRVVRAYEAGSWAEVRKWVARNKALASSACACLLALVAGGLTSTVFAVRASERAVEATHLRNDAIARERVMSARADVVIARTTLEDLIRESSALWPATPENIEAMENWLVRATAIVTTLGPSEDGSRLGHRRLLSELVTHARVLSVDEQATLLAEHAAGPKLLCAERRLASLRLASDVRAGHAKPPESKLAPALAGATTTRLNKLAFQLVDPDRTEFGREAEGLALATAALAKASPFESAEVEDTLAWSLFALGRDHDAFVSSRAALAHAPRDRRDVFEGYTARLARAIEDARLRAGNAEIRTAEQECKRLRNEVFGPRFSNQEDRWWCETLEHLVGDIETFADPTDGLMRGTSRALGWSVERRLAFAREIEERTVTGPVAREAWALARATLRDPSRAPAYGGLELAPQIGLLPVGADRSTGLYEFADFATGEPPVRGASGRLILTPESSVVFVLLPGGTATIGAQRTHPNGENYDPQAQPDEAPVHTVELAPFFLAKHELTQGQWLRFTGRNPSKHLAGTQSGGRVLDDRSPVEQVSWFVATEQLTRLGWQLPSEAQWEYAARAGAGVPWWTGEETATLEGACNLADRFARDNGAPFPTEEVLDDGHLVHAAVGSFEANPFGLYDVIGNVSEWCRDRAGEYTLPVTGPDAERKVAESMPLRIIRGGGFMSRAAQARVSRRDSAQPELASNGIGIRPARVLVPKASSD